MTTATLTRSQRGMQIERRTYRQWAVASVGITVPSQTKLGTTYNTTLDGCSCKDHQYRPGLICKHMQAARIFMGRNK